MKFPAVLALALTAPLFAQEPALGPDSYPQSGVPRGSVTWHTLAPGKFYPGTPHRYAVYLPAWVDPGRPAPFMIFLDGTAAINGLRAPAVLDNLIARGQIPRLVGIFVDPGILPALSQRDQNRYERIFEYDSLSDRFARFLLEELAPEVGKIQRLSARPDDHAIAGVSTGAVGAFVAAWLRPDQFHRVLSLIGTYVDMKGAEELPSLVRKTEPRPVRIFLQDGRNDHIVPGQPWGTFFAGSWPINNQVMFEALEFAGYDARLVMGDGLHNVHHGAALLPEALHWLWSGYPAPMVVHEPAAESQPGYDPRGRVYATVSADRPWVRVHAGKSAIAGLASDRSGEVFFSEPAAGRILRVGLDGNVTPFLGDSGGATALACGPEGRLYASQPVRRRIVSFGEDGGARVEAERVDAAAIALSARGEIVYLDADTGAIGRVGGPAFLRRGAPGPEHPAGLAFSSDQAMLVVADRVSRFGWSFQVSAGRSLANGEPFYRLYLPEMAPASGLADVAFDTLGHVYFAGPLGIQVAEENGRIAAVLNGPDFGPVSHLAFGGEGQTWLYAASGPALFRRPTKVVGATVWTLVKPPQPAL